MNVRCTETALAEIESILSEAAQDSPLAVADVAILILTAIQQLSRFPDLAVETDVRGIRVAPLLPYRYLVFYSTQGGTLVVRNVRHSARDTLPA